MTRKVLHSRLSFPMHALLALVLTAIASSSVPAQVIEKPAETLRRNPLVTVNFDKTPLKSAAEELLRDTGLKLRIEGDASAQVSMKLQDVPLDQAILVMLRSTGLTGRIEDGTLVIYSRPKDLLPRGNQPFPGGVPPSPDRVEPAGPRVRVGLNSRIGKCNSITIACSGGCRIRDMGRSGDRGNTIQAEQITLTVRDGAIEISRLSQPVRTCKGPVRIEADGPTTALEVVSPRVKYARYAGVLEISAQGSVLRVVNEVPLDEYVRGVIPTEIPASFHPEAQKALVVAARTYAVRSADRHKADGFNMCDSTHCQGFAGASKDAQWVNDLVDATRGEIITCKGEPIFACYSADCGGMTQSSEDAGMMKTAYLRSVVDNPCGEPCLVVKKQVAGEQLTVKGEQSTVNGEEPESPSEDASHNVEACPAPAMTEFEKPATGDYCGSSRVHTWTKTYSAEDLEKVFSRSSSTKVGKVISMEFAEYDCSGRVKTIIIKGEDGEKRLSGSRFRDLFGLSTIMSTRMALTITPDGKYVIEGRGYGHGVGLCQWGANGLAKSDPLMTYIEILRHYYTDIEITVLGEK